MVLNFGGLYHLHPVDSPVHNFPEFSPTKTPQSKSRSKHEVLGLTREVYINHLGSQVNDRWDSGLFVPTGGFEVLNMHCRDTVPR